MLDAGGGQLEGKRKPVQSGADRLDRGPIILAELEILPHGPRSIQEERPGVVVRKGLDRVLLLARHAEDLAARRQHLYPLSDGQETPEDSCDSGQ